VKTLSITVESKDDLQAEKKLLEALVEVARATAKRPALPETLQNTLDVAAHVTEAEGGSLFLLDKTGAITHSLLALGKSASQKTQSVARNALEKGLAGWVARTLEPALISNTAMDARWLPSPETLPDVHAALSLPIVHGEMLLGILTLTHAKPEHFTTSHLTLMEAAADQMALALRNAQIFEEQRHLAQRLSTVYEVLRGISETLNPKAVPHVAVTRTSQLTGWPVVAVLMPDDDEQQLIVQATTNLASVVQGWRLPIAQSLAGHAYTTEQPQYTRKSADESYEEIAVPLRHGSQLLGVLDVQSNGETAFTPDDIQLAELLADAIALALDSARVHAEVGRYVSDLGGMYMVARAITQSLILEDVLAETLKAALAALDFNAGWIALLNPHTGSLELTAERGLPPSLAQRLRQGEFHDIHTLNTHVQRLRRPIMIDDIEKEIDTVVQSGFEIPPAIAMIRALRMRACVCIPLLHQGRSLGAMTLLARHALSPSPHHLALHVATGQQVATAVVNAQLFQAVEDERSRLQALIESSQDGILFIASDGRLLVVNAQALHFLGVTPEPAMWIDRAMGEMVNAMRHHARPATYVVLEELRRIQSGDTALRKGEIALPPRTLQWLHAPIEVGAKISGRLIVLRDVTAERALEQTREDLTRAMVHDLRSPLTGILGGLDLLKQTLPETTLTPTQSRILDFTQAATEQMLGLVNAILDISRLESGRMPIVYTQISLRDLVQRTLGLQMPRADEKGIALTHSIAADLPQARADEGLIARVLQNLVGNAIKFTPPGGTVAVEAHADNADDDDDARLHLCVRDTGAGIPPAMHTRLFQKFATGSQDECGSGLGLAFCKMVLDAHGERIWLEHSSPQGATFCFTLPRA
jgi:signal transduction histidine kinase